MNTAILENIGFTKGEIKVYFSLLELGTTTSGPVITRSRVARSKVYDIIEKLKSKGLISESIHENTKYFQASSPDRILDFIKSKQRQIQEQEHDFTKILPKLKQKHKPVEKQEAKIYVGLEGIRTFYNDTIDQLSKGDEFLSMICPDKTIDDISIMKLYQRFHLSRARKGIKARIIANKHDRLARTRLHFAESAMYESRFTDHTLPSSIAIFKDTVATFHWGKIPRVFVMVCKDNADQYRKFFNQAWSKSK